MKSKNHVFLTLVMVIIVGLMTACLKSADIVTDFESEPAQVESPEAPETEEDIEQPMEEMDAEPSLIAEAGIQPTENNGVEEPSIDTADSSLVYCDTGTPAPRNGWSDELTFEIVINGETINFSTTTPLLLAEQLWYAGIDFRSISGYTTSEVPGFALGAGTTFGVSTGFQGDSNLGISAIRAGEQGEILPWETAATAGINDGVLTITIPINEYGNDMKKFRFTVSDGEICQLSAPLEQDLGFLNFAEFVPEDGKTIINNAGESICFPDLCFSVPQNAGWELTGDHTGSVNIAGSTYTLQSYVSSNNRVEILDTFESIGWTVVPDGVFDSAIGDFQQYDMQVNNTSFGSLGLNMLDDSENPRTVVVTLNGQTPISAENRESFFNFLNQVQGSVRRGS